MAEKTYTFKSFDLYRLLVREVLQTHSTNRISNDSDEYAKILISELIDFSKTTIDILSHQLSSDIWLSKEVFDSIKEAVNRGIKFRVVTEHEIDEKSYTAFNQLGIKVDCSEYITTESDFMIVDNEAFRVAANYMHPDGFAYVNNHEYLNILINAFNFIYEHKCTNYDNTLTSTERENNNSSQE